RVFRGREGRYLHMHFKEAFVVTRIIVVNRQPEVTAMRRGEISFRPSIGPPCTNFRRRGGWKRGVIGEARDQTIAVVDFHRIATDWRATRPGRAFGPMTAPASRYINFAHG